MFSYWPCYRSEDNRIGLLARGGAEGQYSHQNASTISRGPVTGPIWKHPIHDIFIKLNQLFVLTFKVLKVKKKIILSSFVLVVMLPSLN